VSEVIQLSLQVALNILFPALVLKKDLPRLSAEQLSRAWNDASLWSAVVGFGPFSLIVHFTRTRRSIYGLLLGFAWAACAAGISAGLAAAFELAS
jgi:hypothetical protein